MSLLDVLRAGVKVADSITKPLQATVTFARCTGTDANGTLTYATSTSLRAVIDWKMEQRLTADGRITAARLNVLFLDVAALLAATAGVGLTDKDKITLPNGETGNIVNIDGFLDAGTGRPVATQAFIG